jgi:TolB-like protein/Tfp pilus assembly protein PilF
MNSALSSEGSEQIRSLFRELVALDPRERDGQLERIDRLDPAIARELLSLLEAHDRSPEVLDRLDRWLAGPAQSPSDTSSPSLESTDALLGRQVSHYQILEKLGGGGMGVVYKARDLRLERTVALKFLPPHLSLDEDAKQRFIREAKAASALDHPNICTIYEIDECAADDGAPAQLFIAMAYYAGETLKKKIERGPLPVRQALDYAAQIAAGLAAAHEAGIIHRDIKPANVLVTGEGVAKVVDFGIAKAAGPELTKQGRTLGTAAYMSPEQARGEPVDHRTDLWSLGAVLYEMLAGQRAFPGETSDAVIYAIRHDEPQPIETLRPDVGREVAATVSRCLAKQPAERYARAEALLGELRASAQGPAAAPRVQRPWRGRSLRYSIISLVLVLLIGGARALLAPPPPAGRVLAVLPVANVSGDAEQEPLADGLTELLINQLSQISGLDRVIPHTSVMPYKNTHKPLRQIGRELGVDLLVESSVLRAGEHVRVDVSLIKAAGQRTFWSDSFERPLSDVLRLQREMAQAIAREVQVVLTPAEAARLRQAAPAVDPEAFTLYLRAQRRRGIEPGRIADLEQAVALDSGFAAAYAALAGTYAIHLNDYDRAEEAVERALALDPDLPRAHVTRALIRQWAHSDWVGAEAALRRALELTPLVPETHHELAMLLMRLGRFEEALAAESRALYLAPSSSSFQEGLGEIFLNSGRYEDAIREFEKTLRMDPTRIRTPRFLGDAHFFLGRYGEAVRWYEQSSWGIPSYAYTALGRRQEALAALDSMLARVERGELYTRRTLAGNLAMLYASLGEHDRAMDWLERAVEERLGWIPVDLKVTPRLAPLRSHPRTGLCWSGPA